MFEAVVGRRKDFSYVAQTPEGRLFYVRVSLQTIFAVAGMNMDCSFVAQVLERSAWTVNLVVGQSLINTKVGRLVGSLLSEGTTYLCRGIENGEFFGELCRGGCE